MFYRRGMNNVSIVYVRTDEAPPAVRELSRVRLTRSIATESGRVLPAGSCGTVVGTWAEGQAYEVEFLRPFTALEAVERIGFDIIEQDDR